MITATVTAKMESINQDRIKTHLDVKTLTCSACKRAHHIEVDTPEAMKEAKDNFKLSHAECGGEIVGDI